MSDFVLFLGRFHPLVVHLPIGFLLFALILEVAERVTKNGALSAAVPIALLSGAISAFLACILGYMLSLGGGYDEDMLNGHLWFGVFTTLTAFFAWLVKSDRLSVKFLQKARPNMALLTVMVVLLGITGHYGGNLTHGEDYLVKYAPFREKAEPLPKLAKLEDATVYPYLVQPVFEAKCTGCHNASKKKGGLAMHTFDALIAGGEGGSVVTPGDLGNSELVRRISLPQDHDDVMPPEGKTPLTEQETALVKFWIEQAQGNQEARLGDIEVPDEVRQFAAAQLGFAAEGGTAEGAGDELPAAVPLNMEAVNQVVALGFGVRELVDGSGLVEITLPDHSISKANISEWEKHFELLLPLKDQILWMDLGGNAINDNLLRKVSEFGNLRKLVLDNTDITDEGIANLVNLKNLESLNLYNTQVSDHIVPALAEMPKLKKVYVWRTKITEDDIKGLGTDTKLELISGV
ncbi:c-type cytochrome domain-containing protein [Pseudozobellia thermophila]|uniref:c-type cytochrome domain-containing protein n=1 Tax=Pseudozobellia thermophila TaxID=192903 RepID=UPI00147E842D|nr:c-type cytochrome domain-containing protein [Pseudozobellia thermophila]